MVEREPGQHEPIVVPPQDVSIEDIAALDQWEDEEGQGGTGETYDDPAERVEDFLVEHADVSEKAATCWRAVRSHQRNMIDDADVTMVATIKPKPNKKHVASGSQPVHMDGRGAIRINEAAARQLAREDTATARADASIKIKRWLAEAPDWSDEAIRALAEGHETGISRQGTLRNPTTTADYRRVNQERRSNTRVNDLSKIYILAYAYQAKAAHVVVEALQNDELVLPLLERLAELARDSRSGVKEFPGLLESLAVHQAQEKAPGAVSEALARVLGASLREEFVRELLSPTPGEKKPNLSKEVVGLVAGMHLTSSLLEQSTGRPIDNLAELLLAYPSLWTEELEGDFATYTKAQTASRERSLHTLLESYLERGRLLSTERPHARPGPPQTGKPTIDNVRASRERRQQQSRQGGKPKAALSSDAEELREETEPRVTMLGHMKRIGGGQRYFALELVKNVDALMALPNIADYIRKHQTEPGLSDTIRACLESLIKQPFQPPATRRFGQGNFSLNVEGEKATITLSRVMKRLSLKRLPGIPTGSISKDTRIYFDVPDIDGQSCLVIHGVFHKNEVAKKQSGF